MRCVGLRPLAWLAAWIARWPQSLLLALAKLLRVLCWWPLARRRRIAARNLQLCFPDWSSAQRDALLRRNLDATVMGALELLRAWYAPASLLQGRADFEGIEALEAAIAKGEGVLLLTSHFTHTELAVRLLSLRLGRELRGVVRRNNSACVEAELEHARTRAFGPTLEKKDLRGLLRALQSGETVAYSGDQDFSYQNAFVPFFGVAAATLVGTPELVARGKAGMFAVYSRREPDGRYRLRVEPEWPGWREATPEKAAAMYMQALEAQVRLAPEQYLWVHRRFKTRPPGAASLYA
jgi:KDO2-lipid IV(A) lauroyltransferase